MFSKKFTVETASKNSSGKRLEFRQSWENNMSKAKDHRIKDASCEDYTRISFQPDLPKFNMETLDDDTVALLSRRAYDIAASTRGVKVRRFLFLLIFPSQQTFIDPLRCF